jgi:hypothetical protein
MAIEEMKVNSEVTLEKAIEYLKDFLPIKIVFNDIVLYNDTGVSEGNELSEETYPFNYIVPKRIEDFKDAIVTSITIYLVEYHHSVINIKGEYTCKK